MIKANKVYDAVEVVLDYNESTAQRYVRIATRWHEVNVLGYLEAVSTYTGKLLDSVYETNRMQTDSTAG